MPTRRQPDCRGCGSPTTGCASVGSTTPRRPRVRRPDRARRRRRRHEPLLIDWRAPAARPFYCATAASPEGVARRRHIRTRRRRIVGFDDEVLDLDAAGRATDRRRGGPAGRGHRAPATGRMRDIVATIQAEQDEVIRLDLRRRAGRAGRSRHRQDRRRAAPRRVPALHPPRAAGPPRRAGRRPATRRSCATSPQVLPSLGETGGACFATPASCSPACRTSAEDEPAAIAAGQGRAGDGRRAGRGGRRPAAGARRAASEIELDDDHRPARRRDLRGRARTGPAAPACRTTRPGRSSSTR